MIFLFTFCLYYVLHDRHHKLITLNSLSTSTNLQLTKLQHNNYSSSIHFDQTRFIGFSDYRFIICIILLLLLGLTAIPIGGLTGFHIYLIAQGRTTNEQVTGKYRLQNDIFNRRCWKNFCYILCQPLYPQLKSPKMKRYNVELFEQMAYQTKKSKRKFDYETTYKLNVYGNSMDEKGSILNSFKRIELNISIIFFFYNSIEPKFYRLLKILASFYKTIEKYLFSRALISYSILSFKSDLYFVLMYSHRKKSSSVKSGECTVQEIESCTHQIGCFLFV